MHSEDKYVDIRLKSFFARREGDTAKADELLAAADKIWAKLSPARQSWARKEVMAQVMAIGMNKINETYGW